MSDILSQDEIDALLHGVDDVVDDAPEQPKSQGVKAFDFPRRIGLSVAGCRLWS
ncbi:hypothetical protein PCI56_10920 [Plesiomonas shigelloides subsp. oncorhynchi]|nr:hypothetical protein [Plesiomonas shigelloides]